MSGKCPNCGYCPHCGRKDDKAVAPYPGPNVPFTQPWINPYPIGTTPLPTITYGPKYTYNT